MVLAIGNGALCECLSRKLPVNTYFRSYASIANQERKGQSTDNCRLDKKVVDQCVTDSHKRVVSVRPYSVEFRGSAGASTPQAHSDASHVLPN